MHLTLLFALAGAAPAPAANAPLTLPVAVQRARDNDLRVQEAEAELQRLQALYREASWAWFPKFESFVAIGGPTPEARNNGLGGPPLTDATLMYDLNFGEPGVMFRTEMSAFMPLVTFGKLTAVKTAAKRGVEVGENLRERARNEAGFQAAQAYFGYQLARQGEAALEDTLERLIEAEKLILELLEQESSQVTKMDTYKVQYFRQQIESRRGQVRAGRELARQALKLLVGADPKLPLEIAEQDLEMPEFPLRELEQYQQAAAGQRPELSAIRAGIAAREQEVLIRQRLFFPDFGLAGFFRWMWTSSATRQKSPFAYDPYNDLSGGVALVGRATFDFPTKDAQLEQSRAELRKLETQRAQLEAAISLEVQKAWGDVQDALTRARAFTDAERNARRWATAAYASFELGTSDTRELIDAFTALALASTDKMKAWHDAQVGLAELARVTGR